MLSSIDVFLNKITMYRLMLYYLIALIAFAALFGLFGFLPYDPQDVLLSAFIAITVGYISNYFFSKIFKAQTNVESVFITSLILVLIMPVGFPKDSLFLALASFIAMASKYILAFKKRHIFNPAAVSAVLMSIFFGYAASWWVGALIMLPAVTLGGLLILRKTQREKIAIGFIFAYLFIVGAGSLFVTGSLEAVLLTWQISIFHSALFFFMFVMLIEPLTSPTTNRLRIYYSFVVALFYALPQVKLTSSLLTPEMALLIGNVFSYFINPNYRLMFLLKNKIKLSKDTYSFIFEKQKNFNFVPGQYMEWTLPHKNADERGNRRYFTISSSPTEEELFITVKFYDSMSSYKRGLFNLREGRNITASYVSGDFVLPKNLKTPLVFIAGGVGITPFRSIIKYMIDKNLSSDIVLIYSNRAVNDILFSDIFEKAKENGVKTIYTLTEKENIPSTWKGKVGYIDEKMIKEEVPDYKMRSFYVSGPQLMVRNFEKMLVGMGINKNKIKTDFFPGYLEHK